MARAESLHVLSPTLSEIFNEMVEMDTPSFASEFEEEISKRLVELNEEEMILPMDETHFVENQETRSGKFSDQELFKIMLKYITGDELVDYHWISPSKINYVKELRRIYRYSRLLVRSPTSSLAASKLDNLGFLFYETYQGIIGESISVSPREKDNYFKSFFLPLAEYDESILYALTGWGGMALAGKQNTEARNYMAKARQLMSSRQQKLDLELLKLPGSRNISVIDVILVLSYYLICMGAEVTSGDVKNWVAFMNRCYKILSKIGLKKFLLSSMSCYSREAMWLISNFFYHDITHLSDQPTSFTIDEYKEVFAFGGQSDDGDAVIDYGIDPLNGCNTSLYLIQGEIINMYNEFIDKTQNFKILDQDTMKHYAKVCESLETKITEAKPPVAQYSQIVSSVEQNKLELYLTSFELLQISLRLLCNLLLKRLPPATSEIQVLRDSALDDIRVLVGSEMETVLNFPLLITSICSYKKYDRFLVTDLFHRVLNFSRFTNVSTERCIEVLNEYWIMNPEGKLSVNWFDILRKLDWELSLL